MEYKVTKGSGEKVAFEPDKLKRALAFSGAGKQEQEHIANLVESRLYDGISTKKIYQMAYALLKKRSRRSAGRYSLKNAIMELGPTGYPFEKFVAKLFESEGYQVQTGVQVQGKCVQHEVDVVARKPGLMVMIECKFHSDNSRKSDVKIPLYIQSRYLDVKAGWEKQYGEKEMRYIGGVVTNTRFTDDAMNYGKCAGLELVSWDYPSTKSLKYWIDKSGLHPLTTLTTLTKREKHLLLEQGIVLCNELEKNPELLMKVGISEKQINKVLLEAKTLVAQ
ncbi:MAG TPA: restriction endonuclease [Bacteroidales bacterium]